MKEYDVVTQGLRALAGQVETLGQRVSALDRWATEQTKAQLQGRGSVSYEEYADSVRELREVREGNRQLRADLREEREQFADADPDRRIKELEGERDILERGIAKAHEVQKTIARQRDDYKRAEKERTDRLKDEKAYSATKIAKVERLEDGRKVQAGLIKMLEGTVNWLQKENFEQRRQIHNATHTDQIAPFEDDCNEVKG